MNALTGIGLLATLALATSSIWALRTHRRRLAEAAQTIRTLQSERDALVTAHGEAEARLTSSEQRLRLLLESEPECVKLHTCDGSVLEMNPAGLAMMDARSAGQVIGRSIFSFIAEEHRQPYIELTERVFRGESGRLEFRLTSLQGRLRWMETSAAPLRDENGRIIALLGVTRDMTERRAAEEQDRQHLSALAHVVRTCTMGEMATNLAHELNQPLAAIVNYTRGSLRRLRAQAAAAPEVLESLEHVCTQAERAAGIIRNLRTFLGKREPALTALDLNDIVQTTSALIGSEARAHGVSILFSPAADLPPARGSRIEVEQVLLNLMRNAIEAMTNAASPCREIRVSTGHGDDDFAFVDIADSGPGIDGADPSRIFQPFFTSKDEGMGMGLPISRSIIEAHGGQLWLAKNDNDGATFRFTLQTGETLHGRNGTDGLRG
ncbi:nitrogen regulation protein NR(II) [Methyloversatilis sp.]|uniref:two-component system sensor histidine kinase NtrB n=1 Tax=Methyloversatilis sp. TaxID=2569862 RepID=UPI0035AF9A60